MATECSGASKREGRPHGSQTSPWQSVVEICTSKPSEMLCAWDLGEHHRGYPHMARVGMSSQWIMHSAAGKEPCHWSGTIRSLRSGTSPHSCSLRSAPMSGLSLTGESFSHEIQQCWVRHTTRNKDTTFLGQEQEKCILWCPSVQLACTIKRQVLHKGMLQKTRAREEKGVWEKNSQGGAQDLYLPGPVYQWGMGAIGNCCSQETGRANCFKTQPIIQHNLQFIRCKIDHFHSSTQHQCTCTGRDDSSMLLQLRSTSANTPWSSHSDCSFHFNNNVHVLLCPLCLYTITGSAHVCLVPSLSWLMQHTASLTCSNNV